jgi:hypothetical protein
VICAASAAVVSAAVSASPSARQARLRRMISSGVDIRSLSSSGAYI